MRFLSVEPMLGPIKLGIYGHRVGAPDSAIRGVIDWVICGGESGPHARAMHPAWARSLRDQCAAACVPMLFKQWGEWLPVNVTIRADEEWPYTSDPKLRLVPGGWVNGSERSLFMRNIGKKAAGRLLDGVEHNGYPTP